MRLLLLSDVHGNLEALEACLDAAPACDRVVSLGDVVGYGASPNQTAELVRATGPIGVRGNHDRVCSTLIGLESFNPWAAEAARWTFGELTGCNLGWLQALPRGPVFDPECRGAQFVHGSPLDEDTYLSSATLAGEALERSSVPLTFFGHTHIQCAYGLPGSSAAAEEPAHRGIWSSFGKAERSAELLSADAMPGTGGAQRRRLKLDPAWRYLVNPGSVGQPRDRDRRAAFALYDSDAREVHFYRVPYDIAGAQRRILEAGLPSQLARRLQEGR